MTVPYDAFADIYDQWVASAPAVTEANRRFYVQEFLDAEGPVVELGVGNGRIAIEAAKEGKHVIGVDSSRAMLRLARKRADEAGVGGNLTLIEADFTEFEVPEPASLVAIPFHSIGHLLEEDARRACMERAREALAPGGRFVFDHFVYDPAMAAKVDRTVHLRSTFTDEKTGGEVLLWFTSLQDRARCRYRMLVWTEVLDLSGLVVQKRVRQIDFSWMEPAEARRLLGEAGFEVEKVYGNFEREPFDEERSGHQIWFARRPS